ncbi:MAG: GntR family transcriptional regulator [Mobilicoccus sp.]|nr:GntR family transcriptional regulator [Mobilicoccus sp.]
MGSEVEQALYKQLAAELRERIEDGEFRAGDRLPTNVELAASSGLTRVTVQQAIKLLKAEGVVETRRGGGTVVAQPKAGLAHELLERRGEVPERVHFYGLTADEVIKEVLEATDQGASLPAELVALTPPGGKDSARGHSGATEQAGAEQAANAGSVGRSGRPVDADRSRIREQLEVRTVELVPGYRIAAVDYGRDGLGARRDPVAIIYVRDARNGGIRAVPPGALGASEVRSVRSWLAEQVKSVRQDQ